MRSRARSRSWRARTPPTSPAPSSRSTAAWEWAINDANPPVSDHESWFLMGILDGKRILVTGVLTDASIAFHVAKVAQQEGATAVVDPGWAPRGRLGAA